MYAEPTFRKSSFSDPNQECVEVARHDDWVQVRDSKAGPDDGRLTFVGARFTEFLDGLGRR
ncbi:DUF397 domain-containing protein [Actinophytocola sp.]|uniref:DUF397 domain-containing protein n=1 Tax=Actinophytocola sp. TaxID=1872138 RepID=UPI002D7E64A5|nr:DUF397 domain-containing protein [Actinophytocola sp.]HET9137729.1 DUF397 domain-containing protein [Actinophytocola sp.]